MPATKRANARPNRNLIGARVCKARSEHPDQLTQDQLAGRLAVLGVALDRVTIAKVETGLRCVYDYEVVAFAEALGTDVRWLLGLKDGSNAPKKKSGLLS
jgi:hypothetical protein